MMTDQLLRPMRILVVEDNPGDMRLVQESFREASFPNIIQPARDGMEALAFLRREPPFENAWPPDIVMLDLNLPRMDGLQVLAAIKGDAKLRRIPVVILTSSTASEDLIASYDLHANCYIRKPLNFEDFMGVVQAIRAFWFGVVSLPPEQRRNGTE